MSDLSISGVFWIELTIDCSVEREGPDGPVEAALRAARDAERELSLEGWAVSSAE